MLREFVRSQGRWLMSPVLVPSLPLFYHSYATEYIHRVGRTARGKDGQGRALLMLLPEELGFLKYLKEAKVIVYLKAWMLRPPS
jgi:hypothetical protein